MPIIFVPGREERKEMKEDTKRARENAKMGLENLVAMVNRLEHAGTCDPELCKLSDKEIKEGLGYFYDGKPVSEEERAMYHNMEKAEEVIHEDPLSVQVRSDWENPSTNLTPAKYMILLSTGGPALRIIGTLDEHREPDSAILEYQDWGTEWIEYINSADEELLTYARQFYFGA